MAEELRFKGEVRQVTVRKVADYYYASFLILVEENPFPKTPPGKKVGIDLGLEKLASLSDGYYYERNRTLSRYLRKLRRLSRNLSRKQKGSVNYGKARAKLARLHHRICNIRDDYLHKVTTEIVGEYSTIHMEDLHIRGMVRNRRLSKALVDASLYRFKEMVAYKAKWRGVSVGLVDRFFPSSKTCSECGTIHEGMTLKTRELHCDCGLVIDRDLNAAINVERCDVSYA
jgi:putative transposase